VYTERTTECNPLNYELAIRRLATNLEKAPGHRALARLLPTFYARHGLPLEVGVVRIMERSGSLVALVDGEVVASSTQRANQKRQQRGEGTGNNKRRSVNCDDATWEKLERIAANHHEGNVSEIARLKAKIEKLEERIELLVTERERRRDLAVDRRAELEAEFRPRPVLLLPQLPPTDPVTCDRTWNAWTRMHMCCRPAGHLGQCRCGCGFVSNDRTVFAEV
jgi:hypothetical protein